MRRKRQEWKKVLRRAAALFLATLGLWILTLAADIDAASQILQRLGESPQFVAAALRTELGEILPEEGPTGELDYWQRLVLSQSPLLKAGEGAVAAQLEGGESILPESPEPVEPDDPEDLPDLPQTTTAPEGIREQTLTPKSSQRYDHDGDVYIYNRTSQTVDVAALAAAPVEIELSDDGPQILIMHTHGSEAYTQDGEDIYEETDPARTTDETCNMIRVGDEMEQVFTEMGLKVIHDRNLYDYPAYNGAYDRSKAAVEKYLEEYPAIKVVLDVHRDALVADDGTIYKTVTQVDGEKAAQILFVVGTDDGGLSHPQWQQNLTLAVKIQQTMNSLWPTLARPITLRTSRFNQQLTTGSLLVEVGSHGNTLQEALRGARLFARAAGQVLLELK